MHRFWEPVIGPIMRLAAPRAIVEIGAEAGANTRNLLFYSKEHAARVHVIEPRPKFDVAAWRAQWGDAAVFHLALSLNALPKIEAMDLVLIDGDHNWHTVHSELALIWKNTVAAGRPFPMTLLSNVGWPYARRDLYYDPDVVPPAFRHPYKQAGMVPGEADLTPDKGLNPHLRNAIYENNLRSGVRTALEDFVAEHEGEFTALIVPGFHGLGVLYRPRDYASNVALGEFLAALPASGVAHEFAARLEEGRLGVELERLAAVRAAKTREAAQRQKLEAVQTELRTAQAKTAETVAETARLREALAERGARIETLSDALARVQGESKGLEAAYENLRVRIRARVAAALSLVAEKLARMEARAREEAVALAQSHAADRAALEAESEARAGAVDDLRAALTQAQAEAAEAHATAHDVQQQIAGQVSALSATAEDLQEDLARTQADAARRKDEALRLRDEFDRQRARDADEARRTLRGAHAEKEQAVAALQLRLDAALQRESHLKTRIETLEASTAGKLLQAWRGFARKHPRHAARVKRGAKAVWWGVTLQLPQRLADRRVLLADAGKIRKSRLLDEGWYRARYLEGRDEGADPAIDYLTRGAAAGCDPGPWFSTNWYASAYPEAVAGGVNPLIEFLSEGWRAGRNPGPAFDARFYLTANPDVHKAAINPLEHYVKFGKKEGRLPRPAQENALPAKAQLNGHHHPNGRANGASMALSHAAQPRDPVLPRPERRTRLDIVVALSGADADEAAECLADIARWRAANDQVIVIDDGAEARALIERHQRRDPDIMVARNLARRGLVAAVRQGLAASTAPFVAATVAAGAPSALFARALACAEADGDIGLVAVGSYTRGRGWLIRRSLIDCIGALSADPDMSLEEALRSYAERAREAGFRAVTLEAGEPAVQALEARA